MDSHGTYDEPDGIIEEGIDGLEERELNVDVEEVIVEDENTTS